ncbi:MAG: hypothetical protein K6C05_06700 [Anaerovibrio sp.]|uniref:hypothetical protein n=1 Tax=Anaerovibrio sp. TaxID=1872532 RepID=UPI0025CF8BED|nr:hypothetical protein [Anaerovibrio sp.]MCR5176528.1 hypothetical protein [Anaerovibrio sp.]
MFPTVFRPKKSLATEVSEKGSVYFDTDVNVNGIVNITTNEGEIVVGHEVKAVDDINMTTNKGDIDIGSAITSTGGSIGLQVGTGDVTIGDNGPDVETVTARDNINAKVDLGKIMIYGKTSTKNGDISMSAGEAQYNPGSQNIIISQNGVLQSGADIELTGRNGDLHVTDRIQSNKNLTVNTEDAGSVYLDSDLNVDGNVKIKANQGDIIVGDYNAIVQFFLL